MTERFTLENGDWIDLRTSLSWAAMKRLNAAERNGTDQADEGLCVCAVAWALRDIDGNPIPVIEPAVDGLPSGTFDALPGLTFLEIAAKALEALGAAPSPLGGNGISPVSRPARTSTSSRISQTPTSSKTTLAGRGRTSSPPPLT